MWDRYQQTPFLIILYLGPLRLWIFLKIESALAHTRVLHLLQTSRNSVQWFRLESVHTRVLKQDAILENDRRKYAGHLQLLLYWISNCEGV